MQLDHETTSVDLLVSICVLHIYIINIKSLLNYVTSFVFQLVVPHFSALQNVTRSDLETGVD